MNSRYNRFLVACAGDANDPQTFGGMPYHLIEAGSAVGLVKNGLSLQTKRRKLKLARYLWNAGQYLKTGYYGGAQYSEEFLEILWASTSKADINSGILNLFQLYPAREMERGVARYFYLDQTLTEVFDYYGTGAKIAHSWREDVLSRERAQYAVADKVIFRSRWAAKLATIKYGLSCSKVAVVVPGANISQSALVQFDKEEFVSDAEALDLKLVFVGKDWYRKGLDRLLGAMQFAKAEGARISLTVVGVDSRIIPPRLVEGLTINWIGFLDKSENQLEFVRLLARHDIGVLLSRREAGGVSLREFGRAGLPVIAPDTGGSPEFAMSDTAKLFAPDASDSSIAEVLITLAENRRALIALKREAWEMRRNFDWSVAVEQLSQHL